MREKRKVFFACLAIFLLSILFLNYKYSVIVACVLIYIIGRTFNQRNYIENSSKLEYSLSLGRTSKSKSRNSYKKSDSSLINCSSTKNSNSEISHGKYRNDKPNLTVQTAAGPLLAQKYKTIENRTDFINSSCGYLNATNRQVLSANRHYPTHQTKYAFLGSFPSVQLNKQPLSILNMNSYSAMATPVTVRIAPPRVLTPSQRINLTISLSPKNTVKPDLILNPCDPKTVVAALKENKKRGLKEKDTILENETKKRRHDSDSESGSPDVVIHLPQKQKRTIAEKIVKNLRNGQAKRTATHFSPNSSPANQIIKRHKNDAISSSYSSTKMNTKKIDVILNLHPRKRQADTKSLIFSESKILKKTSNDIENPIKMLSFETPIEEDVVDSSNTIVTNETITSPNQQQSRNNSLIIKEGESHKRNLSLYSDIGKSTKNDYSVPQYLPTLEDHQKDKLNEEKRLMKLLGINKESSVLGSMKESISLFSQSEPEKPTEMGFSFESSPPIIPKLLFNTVSSSNATTTTSSAVAVTTSISSSVSLEPALVAKPLTFELKTPSTTDHIKSFIEINSPEPLIADKLFIEPEFNQNFATDASPKNKDFNFIKETVQPISSSSLSFSETLPTYSETLPSYTQSLPSYTDSFGFSSPPLVPGTTTFAPSLKPSSGPLNFFTPSNVKSSFFAPPTTLPSSTSVITTSIQNPSTVSFNFTSSSASLAMNSLPISEASKNGSLPGVVSTINNPFSTSNVFGNNIVSTASQLINPFNKSTNSIAPFPTVTSTFSTSIPTSIFNNKPVISSQVGNLNGNTISNPFGTNLQSSATTGFQTTPAAFNSIGMKNIDKTHSGVLFGGNNINSVNGVSTPFGTETSSGLSTTVSQQQPTFSTVNSIFLQQPKQTTTVPNPIFGSSAFNTNFQSPPVVTTASVFGTNNSPQSFTGFGTGIPSSMNSTNTLNSGPFGSAFNGFNSNPTSTQTPVFGQSTIVSSATSSIPNFGFSAENRSLTQDTPQFGAIGAQPSNQPFVFSGGPPVASSTPVSLFSIGAGNKDRRTAAAMRRRQPRK